MVVMDIVLAGFRMSKVSWLADRCSGTNQKSRGLQFAFGSHCMAVAQNPFGPMWISDGRQTDSPVSRCLTLGPVNGTVRLNAPLNLKTGAVDM